MATIYDIAKACGCSTTTVSKVLNGTGHISKKKKEEILATTARLGYVPSHSARTLASSNKSSRLIGIFLHINEEQGIAHEFFSKVLNSFRLQMEQYDYDICFLRDFDDKHKREYQNMISARGIDGAFVFSSSALTNKKLLSVLEKKIPVVGFDIIDAQSFVTSDNMESTTRLVDYLVSQGHQRICYVSPSDIGVSRKRKKGFLIGLEKNGIPFDERMIIRAPYFCADSAKIATDKALSSGINPTVIMYPDDYTALAAIPYLESKGYRVPEDMSLTGFDGLESGHLVHPSIVTCVQDAHALGTKAAELLMKLIAKESVEKKEIIVPTTLYQGDSVYCLKGEK